MSKPEPIDQAALNKMTKARTAMLIDQPFFGTLAMRLTLIQDRSIPTLNVDGKDMRYNPDFINAKNGSIAKSCVAHEVMHCVLDHCGPTGRGLSLSPKRWNYAADYAVNDILVLSKFEIEPGWLHDVQYRNMSAEHIYKLIPEPPPEDGSGNGGPQDEVLPGQKDPAMAAQDAADWKLATAQAANAAKAAGKLPEPLERWVDKIMENKVDWKAEMRNFISQITKDDYSWARANRKMQAAGFRLPGLYSETVGPIHVYSDESGSVDQAITAAFGAEIDAIRQDIRPEKIVLGHFDTHVGKVEEFLPDDEFVMKRYCDGGTDFRPIFKHADKAYPPPMCVVILTDLYGPFPEQVPGYPVLWVTINKKVAPFGSTLQIEI
jgi:Uncharacterized protein conserved in bacteria